MMKTLDASRMVPREWTTIPGENDLEYRFVVTSAEKIRGTKQEYVYGNVEIRILCCLFQQDFEVDKYTYHTCSNVDFFSYIEYTIDAVRKWCWCASPSRIRWTA